VVVIPPDAACDDQKSLPFLAETPQRKLTRFCRLSMLAVPILSLQEARVHEAGFHLLQPFPFLARASRACWMGSHSWMWSAGKTRP